MVKHNFQYHLFAYQRIDVRQVASLLVVVESVAYDEVVGYLHCHILYVEVNLQLVGFDEQRAYMHRLWMAGAYRLHHALHRQTSVDDVLNNYHRAAGKVFVDAYHL